MKCCPKVHCGFPEWSILGNNSSLASLEEHYYSSGTVDVITREREMHSSVNLFNSYLLNIHWKNGRHLKVDQHWIYHHVFLGEEVDRSSWRLWVMISILTLAKMYPWKQLRGCKWRKKWGQIIDFSFWSAILYSCIYPAEHDCMHLVTLQFYG